MNLNMNESTILIIDDDDVVRSSLSYFVSDLGYSVLSATNGKEGVDIINNNDVDMVMVDLRMPKMGGIEFLGYVRESEYDFPVVVISGANDVDLAVDAMRKGAWDYITKPVVSMDIIEITISRMLHKHRLLRIEKNYQIDLEKEVDIQTEKIRVAKEEAIEASRLKTNLLLNLNHETRTPIDAILSCARLLENIDCLDTKQKYINIIKTNGHDLLRILSSIIDISKSKKDKLVLNLEVVNINILILEVVRNMAPFAEGKQLDVVYSSDERSTNLFKLDSLKLSQIIANILHNGIKFSDNGEIEILTSYNNGILKIEVKDKGIGIPDDELKFIFDEFYQGEVKKRLKKGVGLGLSLCKKYIELMKGKISVESIVDSGTFFTVEIPCEEELVDKNKKNKKKLKGNKKILIVDDDKTIQSLLKAILIKKGYQVATADNGKEAVEIALSDLSIDFVVMDINMPIMDGKEATREILKVRKELPIIAHSAFVPELVIEELKEIGFVEVKAKPMNIESFIKILEKY